MSDSTPLGILVGLRDQASELDEAERANDEGYRKARYRIVQDVWAVSERLKSDPAEWRTFVEADLWKEGGPSERDRPKALEWALRIVIPARVDPASGNKKDLARGGRNRALAAIRELQARECPCEGAVTTIQEAGGLAKLAAAHAKRKRGDAPTIAQPKVRWQWSDVARGKVEGLARGEQYLLQINVIETDSNRVRIEIFDVLPSGGSGDQSSG